MHNEMLGQPLVQKVVDHPNLVRDKRSKAIVDVDDEAYNRYMLQKEARAKQEARISQLEETINKVETDISDIKSLLTRLLEK